MAPYMACYLIWLATKMCHQNNIFLWKHLYIPFIAAALVLYLPSSQFLHLGPEEVLYSAIIITRDQWISIIILSGIIVCIVLPLCHLFISCWYNTTHLPTFLLICSSDVCFSIVFQLIVRISNVSISGIPNNAGTSLGTTKNLHILCLLIVTLCIPNCEIVLLLYILVQCSYFCC